MPDLEYVLAFLNELNKHNNKPWFDENRGRYEKARATFERFVDHIINEFRDSDALKGLTARECISRIYRDIRFSRDKSPYHTNMWATIAPGGKKTTHLGYHLALQPQGRSILAGGLWQPTSRQMINFRRMIDDDATLFKEIIQAEPFIEFFGRLEGEKLKTAPQGYDKTHPEIELLKLKQVVVVHYFSDQEVCANIFLERVIAGCRAMRPFLDFLDSASQSIDM